MMRILERRDFLRNAVGLTAGLGLGSAALSLRADDAKKKPLFLISLAQWSLHRAFFSKKLDPLEFAVIAKKDYGIDAVEYVNQFYKDKAKDKKFAAELKKLRRR